MIFLLKFVAILLQISGSAYADLPCRSRNVGGESPVCVCTASYCDTIDRGETLSPGHYRIYESNAEGARFAKTEGLTTKSHSRSIVDLLKPRVVITVDPTSAHQTIEGFGGSVTDAASINILALTEQTQEHLLSSYFSVSGIEYNILRVPIAGSDFSTHPYTYNESPQYDTKLTNYTLTSEDYDMKIPIIHRIVGMATDEVHIIASTWSPPLWMKTRESYTGFSLLKREYFQTYADYHLRFIEEYDKQGVEIWGITTTNEPINGIIPFSRFNSLGWLPWTMASWIVNNLGPTVRSSNYSHVKIFALDDQSYLLPVVWPAMVRFNPEVLSYVDGLATHYYGNWVVSPAALSGVHEQYPDLMLLQTEACEGPMPWHEAKVIYGSWKRAENYIVDIIKNLNNWVAGWIDWNLALDRIGGPNWALNYVDAAILVNEEKDEFIKQPMFYAMGHFSKFMPRGSIRIDAHAQGLFSRAVHQVAVKRPDATYALVVSNTGNLPRIIEIRLPNNEQITYNMAAKSVITVEIQPNQ